jgi:spore coat protein U-like protein
MRNQSVTLGLLATLCLATRPAFALLQTCTLSATPVAFGNYNPANITALAGSGTVTLTCTGLVSLLDSWTISLSTGNSGNYASRQMTGGGKTLLYNLYTGPSLSQIWGNGSAGTGVISETETLVIGTSVYNYTVYGQVTALQDQPPQTYTDSITVTVNY